MVMALLDLPEWERGDLTSLRVIAVGGQRLQEHTARSLKRVFPNVTVQQVFGMAEGLVCYTHLDDLDDVTFKTQGRPLSSADEIKIVDSDGVEGAPGEVGELWCRGPYTLRGYSRSPERNREAFGPDGYYRTDDLARLDPSGKLGGDGTIKDLINPGA